MTSKKYISPTVGIEITPQAYIAELVCQRKCRKENMPLAYKYWNTDDWKKHFKSQITQAAVLFKKYGDIPIIRALEKRPTLWSLRAKGFEEAVKREKWIYDKELASRVVSEDVVQTDLPTMKPMSDRKNLFGEI